MSKRGSVLFGQQSRNYLREHFTRLTVAVKSRGRSATRSAKASLLEGSKMSLENADATRSRLRAELLEVQDRCASLEKKVQLYRVKLRALCIEFSSTNLISLNSALTAIDDFVAAGGIEAFRHLVVDIQDEVRQRANIQAALHALDGE